MFENLTDKLQRAFKNLRGQGKLTEEHLDAALAEIREALLEGDVNVGVADEFIEHVRAKSHWLGSTAAAFARPASRQDLFATNLAELLGREARPSVVPRARPRCG